MGNAITWTDVGIVSVFVKLMFWEAAGFWYWAGMVLLIACLVLLDSSDSQNGASK